MHQEELIKRASEVRQRAHSPCTEIKVGSACIDERGQLHAACNVENHIVGVSLCSERILMGMMISSGGHRVKELAVVSDHNPPWVPCGVCRQALAEFCSPDTPIYCSDLKGNVTTYTMKQIFPFTADYLEK